MKWNEKPIVPWRAKASSLYRPKILPTSALYSILQVESIES